MEQTLLYRDIRYVISPEQDGHRRWTIHHDNAPESGVSGGSGLRGSFKTAVMAAREAIDARLDATTIDARLDATTIDARLDATTIDARLDATTPA